MFVADPSLMAWTRLIWGLRSLSWCQINHEKEHLSSIQLHVFHVGCMRGMLVCNNSFFVTLNSQRPKPFQHSNT